MMDIWRSWPKETCNKLQRRKHIENGRGNESHWYNPKKTKPRYRGNGGNTNGTNPIDKGNNQNPSGTKPKNRDNNEKSQ